MLRVPITVTPLVACSERPASANKGASISVTWTGPNAPGRLHHDRAGRRRRGCLPLIRLHIGRQSGDHHRARYGRHYEIRYVYGANGKTLRQRRNPDQVAGGGVNPRAGIISAWTWVRSSRSIFGLRVAGDRAGPQGLLAIHGVYAHGTRFVRLAAAAAGNNRRRARPARPRPLTQARPVHH